MDLFKWTATEKCGKNIDKSVIRQENEEINL